MGDQIESLVSGKFTARIRYMGASSIITIPAKIVNKLSIQLGDYIEIQIYKRDMNDIE